MGQTYTLIGTGTSPFTKKIETYLASRKISYERLPRNAENEERFNELAVSPILPMLIVTDNDDLSSFQGSETIIDHFEANEVIAKNASDPDEVSLKFISKLVCFYADEWLSRCASSLIWNHDTAAHELAKTIAGELGVADDDEQVAGILERARVRLSKLNRNETNENIHNASFERFGEWLKAHLKNFSFIFGDRISRADMCVHAQLSQLELLPADERPKFYKSRPVQRWLRAMAKATLKGEYDSSAELKASLKLLIDDEMANGFLIWLQSNDGGYDRRRKHIKFDIEGVVYTYPVQRLAARTGKDLRRLSADLAQDEACAWLKEVEGLALLKRSRKPKKEPKQASEDGTQMAEEKDNQSADTTNDGKSETVNAEADEVDSSASSEESS